MPLSIVDESWEMLDPSPDVRAMFLEFNDMFFWGKLSGVEVRWSPRMTLCAGVCSYEGRGGLCSIRLSEPLLKLRPRKDLVETLLHEMIHALLFVTQNNRDRDGHGPEFCKHMHRINKASGTKITVYHSFHDEVDVYRQHWWRCNGPCQSRKPYFGFVKRAMNRAPSSLDPWWEDHRRTCGGTYTKVKEPEGYGKKGKKDGKTMEKKASGNGNSSMLSIRRNRSSRSQDIRNVIPFSGKALVPVVRTPLSTATSTGKKPPVKRSVGNTRVFVNINGSPVRIPKSHSSSSQGADKIKQKSIDDLFNSTSLRKSATQSSVSNTETKRDSLMSPKSTTTTRVTSSPPRSKPGVNISNHFKSCCVVCGLSLGCCNLMYLPSQICICCPSDSRRHRLISADLRESHFTVASYLFLHVFTFTLHPAARSASAGYLIRP
uniref:SprT-like N-terminal domain n=1 Tax=Acanthochromis polyacanthus TaxID=80966 RepID=A0A3Q1F258_9TELE